MTRRLALTTLCAALLVASSSARPARAEDDVRFVAVDVWITVETELAAWQVQIDLGEGADIVGVEGGAESAFAEPAYYDPKALNAGELILAAFTTGPPLGPGRHRVARLHVQVSGPAPEYVIRLMVAADGNGHSVTASTTLEPATK